MAPAMPLDIIYRDSHYIAINKPAGLLVHRSAIAHQETRFALQQLRDQIGQRVYAIHRLDKPTSGVLLFGLHQEAARHLSDAFAQRQVSKIYLAVVRGFTEPHGLIDYPLADEADRVYQNRSGAKAAAAQTAYRTLAQVELPVAVGRYASSRYSLLEINPHTGRRRQIRRHMKHILHPIIGDVKYGEGRHNRFFRATYNCHRLLLSAMQLSFVHPYTQTFIHLAAPLDTVFLDLIRHLGWIEALNILNRPKRLPLSDS
jgi:tRNA pseudouridine65 synthase